MKRRHKRQRRVFWRAALSGLFVWARRAGGPPVRRDGGGHMTTMTVWTSIIIPVFGIVGVIAGAVAVVRSKYRQSTDEEREKYIAALEARNKLLEETAERSTKDLRSLRAHYHNLEGKVCMLQELVLQAVPAGGDGRGLGRLQALRSQLGLRAGRDAVKVLYVVSDQKENATAIKGVSEADLCAPIGRAAVASTKALGHEASYFDPHKTYNIKPALSWGPDVVVLIHVDATGKTTPQGVMGVECAHASS